MQEDQLDILSEKSYEHADGASGSVTKMSSQLALSSERESVSAAGSGIDLQLDSEEFKGKMFDGADQHRIRRLVRKANVHSMKMVAPEILQYIKTTDKN